MKYVVPIYIIFFFAACSPQQPEGVIPREKFVSLLIRMHLLEGDFSLYKSLDQTVIAKNYEKYHALFKRYGTDSSGVANTYEYYSSRQEELLEIYREVLDSLNEMAGKQNSKPKKPVK